MYLVLPYLLIILQLILAIFVWLKPTKAIMVAGSFLMGVGCLYLTGFVATSSWVLSPKVLLYLIVGAVQISYVVMVLFNRGESWRIAALSQPLILPFVVLAGVFPVMGVGPVFMIGSSSMQWHVVSATLAYALLTMAAYYGVAVIARQTTLKAHDHSPFVARLPSLEVLDKAQHSTLLFALAALMVSVVAGSFYTHETHDVWFLLEGKTTLSVITLVLLLTLLIGKKVCGVRGRQSAKFVLLVYVLVMALFGLSVFL